MGFGRLVAGLAPALAASVVLHAGLLVSYGYLIGGAPSPAPRQDTALRARIVPQAGADSTLANASPATSATSTAADPKASELAAANALPLVSGPRYFAASELDQRPMAVTYISFDYPEGVPPRDTIVVARILINELGSTDEVQILSAGPHGAFERLVIDAFTGASYRPGRKNNRQVKSQMTVEVKFVPEKADGPDSPDNPAANSR